MSRENRYVCDHCGARSRPTEERTDVWTQLRADHLYPRFSVSLVDYPVFTAEIHLCPDCSKYLLDTYPELLMKTR